MNSSLIRRARAWLLALLAAWPVLGAQAQPDEFAEWPGRVGRIVEVQGGARLLDRADGQWISGIHNRPLTSGDHLVTEAGARVELRVGSTTLRLAGQTDLEWLRLDDAALVLRLNAGSIAVNIAAADVVPQFEVVTAEGRFRPLQRGHYRIDRRDEASHGTTWRGELRFEGADSELVIPVGYHAEFWLQGPSQVTHYNWREVERDAFSDWVARDERPQERQEAARYVSSEMTGWEDLDEYGRWQVHPEYGGVWVPASVPAGWAPYRMGHWDWIAPWGWTWIDAAPWGFAPFHYGRWVWWGGRWCWAPGQRVSRPVYSPALVAWIGGPHVSIGIRVGSPIAWIPLGPRDPYHPGRRDRDHDRDRDHRRPTPNPPRPPGTVPTGPIMYTNQGVPGAVTAVPGDAFAHRRPVAPAVIADVRPGPQPLTPQAPPARVVPPVPLAPAVPSTGPLPRTAPPVPPGPQVQVPRVPAVPPVPVAPSRPDATRPGRVVEPVMPGPPAGPGQRSGPEAPTSRGGHPVPPTVAPVPVAPPVVSPVPVAPPLVAPVPVAPPVVAPVPVAPPRPPLPATAPTVPSRVPPVTSTPGPAPAPAPVAPPRVGVEPRPPRQPDAERRPERTEVRKDERKEQRKEERKEDRQDDAKKPAPARREGPRGQVE